MATYDLGDVVTLTFEIRDADGALAAATATALTITLPDATTQTLTPTTPTTGHYTAVYTPPTVGRYRARLVATGTNAGVFATGFTVTTAESVEPLVTAARVAAKGHVALPTTGPERAALDAAIDDATGIILGHLGRQHIDNLTYAGQAAVRSVATRVALRMWRNPADVASESYNDMSHSVSDPRLLTGDERDELKPYRSRHRGPILLTPRLPGEEVV